jgi:hypothetical protein
MTVDILSPALVRAAKERVARDLQLSPDEIIVVPYARIPPIPRPPLGNDDGTGRWPTGLNPAFAGHPVFFLDSETRRRTITPNGPEPDHVFALRIAYELLDRGYLITDGDSMSFRPVFPALTSSSGLPFDVVRNAEDRERVERVIAGGYDATLCPFVIGPTGNLKNAFQKAWEVCEPWEVSLASQHDTGRLVMREEIRNLLAGLDRHPLDSQGQVIVKSADVLMTTEDSPDSMSAYDDAVMGAVRVLKEGWVLVGKVRAIAVSLRGGTETAIESVANQKRVTDESVAFGVGVETRMVTVLAGVTQARRDVKAHRLVVAQFQAESNGFISALEGLRVDVAPLLVAVDEAESSILPHVRRTTQHDDLLALL